MFLTEEMITKVTKTLWGIRDFKTFTVKLEQA